MGTATDTGESRHGGRLRLDGLGFAFLLFALVGALARAEAPPPLPPPTDPNPVLPGAPTGGDGSFLPQLKDLIHHYALEFKSVTDGGATQVPGETPGERQFRETFTSNVRSCLKRVMGYDVLGKVHADVERDENLGDMEADRHIRAPAGKTSP